MALVTKETEDKGKKRKTKKTKEKQGPPCKVTRRPVTRAQACPLPPRGRGRGTAEPPGQRAYRWCRPRSRPWRTAPGCRSGGSRPRAALWERGRGQRPGRSPSQAPGVPPEGPGTVPSSRLRRELARRHPRLLAGNQTSSERKPQLRGRLVGGRARRGTLGAVRLGQHLPAPQAPLAQLCLCPPAPVA